MTPKNYLTAIHLKTPAGTKVYVRVRDFAHPKPPHAYFGALLGKRKLTTEKLPNGDVAYIVEVSLESQDDIDTAVLELGTLEFYERKPKKA